MKYLAALDIEFHTPKAYFIAKQLHIPKEYFMFQRNTSLCAQGAHTIPGCFSVSNAV